jgi:dTDP-4-amino-4,6-dideoxygalactose transaminase
MSTAVQSNATTAVPFVDLRPIRDEIGEDALARMAAVVQRGDFVGGAATDEFEAAWANYCGRTDAVGVGNGTDALELTLRALGIGAGDEVIIPANTFIATPAAVEAAGATPRFVDVDAATLLVTADLIAEAISSRTAAVIPVHLFGQIPDMDAIGRVARRAGIAVIEDAAQAHGARWRGRRAGSFGEAACFSFYPGKNLGAFGDGGAVVTDDPALADRVRSLGNHGRAEHSKHVHERIGTNSRLDTLQAAVLLAKLPCLDRWNASRRRAAMRYRGHLSDLPSLRTVEIAADAESVHHLEVIRVPQRDRLATRLAERGIATGIHYPIPCHRQPAFLGEAPLPVCEVAAAEILSLPMYPHLTDAQIDHVATAIAESLP